MRLRQKALVYAAVVNGVAAVPIMFTIMTMASREEIMGKFRIPRGLVMLGWAATASLAAATLLMLLPR